MDLYSHKGKYPQALPESITIETVIEKTEIINNFVTDENGEEETIPEKEVTHFVQVEKVIYPPYTEEQLRVAGYIKVVPIPYYDSTWLRPTWFKNRWIFIPTKRSIHREVKWKRVTNLTNKLIENANNTINNNYISKNKEVPQSWIDYRNKLEKITDTYMTGKIDDVDKVVYPTVPNII